MAWAALFAGMAILTVLTRPGVVPLQWIIGALLLILQPQPALLSMVAVIWGLSLLGLVPELNHAFAFDPLALLFGVGFLETVALAFVRVILVITSWNQFLFYRMLYGTQGMVGLEEAVPDIPEVVPNLTGRLETYARAAGVLGGILILAAFFVPNPDLVRPLLSSSLGLGTVAVGLGVGVAFSPTDRRPAALVSTVMGGAVFILSILSARVISI